MPYLGKEPARVPVTASDIPDNSITAAKIIDGAITVADIADDAVTADKLANSINTDIATGVTANTTANAALPKSGGAMTGAITTNSTFDGRDVGTDGTKLDGIAASANNYVHPNHSGEVTSSADGATVIADNIVDEANLKVSNAPTNGYVLTAQSGNTGGLTWAEAGGGPSLGTDSIIRTNAQTISENITIGSTTNGMSAGPITIADGYTVTVNGNWSVV